jgi:hypothetical protein
MTIYKVSNVVLQGLAADSKPSNYSVGTIFIENDTGVVTTWDGISWNTIIGPDKTETLTNKTLTSPNISNSGTITLPTSTQTLVGRTTTDTLTNKTLTSPHISTIINTGTISLPTTTGTLVLSSDTRLSDARTPTTHASTHQNGGADAIALDTLNAPTDITTLNVTTAAHGLTPKAPNDVTKFLDGTGAWSIPPGSGGVSASSPNTWTDVQTYNDTDLVLLNPLGTAMATLSSGAQTSNVVFTFPVTTSDTVTTNSAVETITNKSMSGSSNTFTNIPDSALSTNVDLLNTSQTITAAKTFSNNDLLLRNPANTFSTTLLSGAQTAARTFTFPVTTSDTIDTIAATQTLTNKTLTAPVISSIVNGSATLTLPSAATDTLVGRLSTDTLTNKTINSASNTVTVNASSATITDTSIATGDILKSNGTKFVRLARGSANAVLSVNSGGTDLAWASLDSENVGTATASGDGTTKIFNVAHSIGAIPSVAFIQCSSFSTAFTYTTTSTNIVVTFVTAPTSGTNNVIFNWSAIA